LTEVEVDVSVPAERDQVEGRNAAPSATAFDLYILAGTNDHAEYGTAAPGNLHVEVLLAGSDLNVDGGIVSDIGDFCTSRKTL